MSKIAISEATDEDLTSLSTIVSRAFHPVNPFFLRLFPDTPRMREWWHDIFASWRSDPDYHVVTAIDQDAQDHAKRIVGVLCIQLCGGPDDTGAEFWTTRELTPDHDPELFALTTAPIAEPRARLMKDRRHYLVHLFGVDHACQGKGIGKMLLQRACEIADNDGHDMFVEANMGAAAFYIKFGFQLLEQVTIPGETPYVEGLLVRASKTQSKGVPS